MPISIRLRHDPAAPLRPLDDFVARRVHDVVAMATLQGRHPAEMERRFEEGHRAYVASVAGVDAGWGWVATRRASMGELGVTFDVPAHERYLWNFVTLPTHRGLGIYPRLLDAIVRAESPEAARFWVAYAPENHASGTGIRKAGFRDVAQLSFDTAGRPALRDLCDGGAAQASSLLGVPVARDSLALCWRCVRAGQGAMACALGACRCDYQQPESGCAA